MSIELTPITRIEDQPKISTKGSFIAESIGVFFFSFTDVEGNLFNPSDINISVLDSDGETAESAEAADWLENGYYAWSWDIPSDQASGLYTIQLDYVKSSSGGDTIDTLTETFVVQESNINVLSPQITAMRTFLESLIGYTQRIPVFHEIGRLNSSKNKAVFSFPRWNQPAGVKVFVNGQFLDVNDGYDVDYLNGKILFSKVLSDYDEVQVNYNFRWFTDTELDIFSSQAVEVFNQYPPHTMFSLINLNNQYARAGVTVAHQAAVFALRRLIMDLHYQEPAKVFGGMERSDKLMGSLQSLKDNIEKDLLEWYKQKAKGPYLGLTKTVSVPEFTLPGGRSRWFRYLFKGA